MANLSTSSLLVPICNLQHPHPCGTSTHPNAATQAPACLDAALPRLQDRHRILPALQRVSSRGAVNPASAGLPGVPKHPLLGTFSLSSGGCELTCVFGYGT
jgi:hypothetical protein